MNDKNNILIIDDELDILDSIGSVLEDEGYKVLKAKDSIEANNFLEKENINIIFLDVWLPDVDGLSMLSTIKSKYKNIFVVMMSGHAGLETAVRATKMGAFDFLEKPLKTKTILNIVDNIIKNDSTDSRENIKNNNLEKSTNEKAKLGENCKIKVKQKTIVNSVVVSGLGLITGRKTALNLLPAPENTGIVFIDINTNTKIKLNTENILTSENMGANSTILANNQKMIKTTEHLLAALNMYGITNLIIKCDEEIPNEDGSGLLFCKAIESAGILEQDDYIEPIIIKEKLVYGEIDEKKSYMIITPFEGFQVTLRIDFPNPIGVETHTFTFESPEHFKNEIGRARSFNYINNIDYAQKNGLAGGGLIGSHIILNENEPINTALLFENEFVRHKILDIVGDMYLLGIPMRAKIEANRSSHHLNHIAIVDIAKKYLL